jgi:hypothetical protein
MRVAMLVGVLMVGLFTTFYRVGWSNYAGVSPASGAVSPASGDVPQVTSGQVKMLDDTFPPPPSYP